MTAKGNIRNLETTFMWTVKSSNHLHSRILDFSSSSLILLVVSEMVWNFSSLVLFYFLCFLFFVTWNFSMQLLSQKHTEKSFYFWTWSPYLYFFLYFLLGVSSTACSSWMWYRHFAHSIRSHLGCLFPRWQRCEPAGISSLFQLAAVTFCYLHIVREAAGLRNNRRLECCMMDVQDLAVEIQSIQLLGRG